MKGKNIRCKIKRKYRRCAFTSWRADLRVTLDADITFARVTDEPLVTPAPRPCDVVATVFSRVLEVKQTGPMPIWLADALEHCPEDSHFSKYRVGMRSIQEAHA